MFDSLFLFCVGTAAVIDTALLLTLVDRRNWRHLAVPIAMLALAVWLFHTGKFLDLMLVGATGRWALGFQWLSKIAMATGLALMPSGLLHAVMRLRHSGFALIRRPQPRYAIVYLPLFVLIPAGWWLWHSPGGDFLQILAPLVAPFTAWMVLVALVSAAVLLRLRSRFAATEYQRFFVWMAVVLCLMALVLVVLIASTRLGGHVVDQYLLLVVVISFLLPAFVFGFFVIRYNFMRLMIEQTIVYGTIVVSFLLFHRLIVGDMTDALGQRFGFDFGVIEGLAVCVLVLGYRPLRERISEALRYLMGSRVSDVRWGSNQLAVEMSRHAEDDPRQLLEWFVGSLAEALDVPYAAGWLWDEKKCSRFRTSGRDVQIAQTAANDLLNRLEVHGLQDCTRRRSPDVGLLDCLKSADAGVAMRLEAGGWRGLFLLGHRPYRPGLGEEELNAIRLLVEQFGVTLRNRELWQRTLVAERRALEQERLSTLGLLASCLAHEVKNPLSSIKTIATVMVEQLGGDSQHAKDLNLILGEVNRLDRSTNELLGFARPSGRDQRCHCPKTAVQVTVQFLTHAARRHSVQIETTFETGLRPLAADENAVREILFNLLGNSIDAAGEGGRVHVGCHEEKEHFVATFTDDGPGISSEVQDKLFEPFATTKPGGTGLGLYIVSRRVRELGGEISCSTDTNEGTTYTVKLPVYHDGMMSDGD